MEIRTECAVSADILKSNYEKFLSRKIPNFRSYLRGKSFKNKVAIVCAAGPSLANNLEAIKSLDGDIYSCKTEKYLRDNGIEPDYDVHVDARESEVKYINPHKDTIYLVSTQCDPKVFDKLDGYKVYGVSSKLSGNWAPPHVITSGANVTSQTLIMLVEMGYKEIHVFGFDCSKSAEDSHVIGSDLRPDKEWIEIKVVGCDRSFVTNPEMLSHSRESIIVTNYAMSKKVKMHVHGNGLVSEVLKAVFIRGQKWH